MRELSEFHKRETGKLRKECKYCKSSYDKNKYKHLDGREYHLKKKYGLNIDDYSVMYDRCHGRCQICGDYKNTLHVDHCHSSLRIRGLLCSNCNTAIGLLRENPVIILSAIDYLNN